MPSSLEHRIGLKVGDSADELTSQSGRIPVRKEAIVISPPMRGSEWLAANGPANASGHRRALIPVGGGVHIAQRVAIDWLQLREDDMSFTGDRLHNNIYRGWGPETLRHAVATVD